MNLLMNNINYMRKEYEIPLSEEISIYEIDPVCGAASGGEYTGSGGEYDDDSD